MADAGTDAQPATASRGASLRGVEPDEAAAAKAGPDHGELDECAERAGKQREREALRAAERGRAK